MSEPRVIKATFSDWRTVKSRKTLQLVFEVPLEATADVLTYLGAPMPDSEIWCALARLETGKQLKAQPPMAKRLMADLPLPQQAALLCNREAFWRFLWERIGVAARNEEDAAAFIRAHCQVTSRAEIRHAHISGALFLNLKADFDTWMKVDA